MTDDHPTEPVTAANYNKYSKGMTHNDAHVLDNKLLVSFTITDAETIKINDGKRELSIGFQADVTKRNWRIMACNMILFRETCKLIILQ